MNATNPHELAEQLQKLYVRNRGALYANSLIQAQTAFDDGDFARATEHVAAARESFFARNKKTLRPDPMKARQAVDGKEAKIKKTLELFDAVLPQLQRMASLQRRGVPKPAATPAVATSEHSPDDLPAGFQAAFASAASGDAQWQIVYKYFDVAMVDGNGDVVPEAIYFLHGTDARLIRITALDVRNDLAEIALVPSNQRMKPVPRPKLVELGRKARLVRLSPKSPEAKPTAAPPSHTGGDLSTKRSGSLSDAPVDMHAFLHLLTAAQQSGIVPGADQIAAIRDRDFRRGRYAPAMEAIERMYMSFTQAMTERLQQIRADELAYRSGRLKMTTKEWLAKQQRETSQTQRIDRARRQFTLVLGGLRVLVASKAD